MAVTLRDIAAEAGVSVMTVSNVINGNRSRVSQTTIDRVQRIVEARGYVPNVSARNLAARRSHVIGVLVPVAADDSLLMSPHNVAVIGGMERALRERGYHLLLRGIADPREVSEAVQAWDLDGALLVGFLDEEIDALDLPADVPLLALDSYAAQPLATGVRTDDYQGGLLAGRLLLERGHRDVLFAGPTFTDIGVVRQRFDGFRAAFVEAGVAWHDGLVASVTTTHDSGVDLGRELKARYPAVTGVFATADILAIGIIEGVTDAGGRVPRDVSVVGYDNLDIGAYVTPRLTTIAQDIGDKVAVAARMLLDAIDDPAAPRTGITLPVRVLERGSVGSPREA